MRLAIEGDALALFTYFCGDGVATTEFGAGVGGYDRGSIVEDRIGS